MHHLEEEAFVCASRVVGRQVGGNQQELGVIRKFNMSVSRQPLGRKEIRAKCQRFVCKSAALNSHTQYIIIKHCASCKLM